MPYKDKEKEKEYRRLRYIANKDKIKENREANKEKINERSKLYYIANKDKKKEYDRLYKEANKEKMKEKRRLYNEANKDKKKEYDRLYKEANKEKMNEKRRLYSKTPQGKKHNTMSTWRRYGVNNVNFILYDKYINTHCCDVCKNEFKNSRDRHLDHNHDTGDFRQILCRACNTHDSWKKKKIEA